MVFTARAGSPDVASTASAAMNLAMPVKPVRPRKADSKTTAAVLILTFLSGVAFAKFARLGRHDSLLPFLARGPAPPTTWSWSSYRIRYPDCSPKQFFDTAVEPVPRPDKYGFVSKKWLEAMRRSADEAVLNTTPEEKALFEEHNITMGDYTQNELALVWRALDRDMLRGDSKNLTAFLEFGIGAATRIYSKTKIRYKTYSVHSSVGELADYAAQEDLAPAVNRLTLKMFLGDIGPTACEGYPRDRANQDRWYRYSSDVFDEIEREKLTPQAVLVDGRFRVACILQAYLRFNRGTPVFVHDFWDRPEYYPVLQYSHVVGAKDSMAVLEVREDVDREQLAKAYEKYSKVVR